MEYRGTTVLITGASAGLGEQFAADFAARGADLVLVARRAERLEALADRLSREYGVTVTPLAADLAEPEPASALRDSLAERGITISTLINNAGFAGSGPFAEATRSEVNGQIAVNVAALTDLTYTFLPDLLDSANGALVNVASTAGGQPIPGMAVYAATKAFVLSLTEALAYELRDSPVRVMTLVPGATRTEFWATAAMKEQGTSFQTPEQVVGAALQALDAPNTPSRVISGRVNKLTFTVGELLPLPRRVKLTVAARALAATQ